MAIDLLVQALQVLTGSQWVKEKLQRNEHVVRVLKQVGLDPDHPPEDFEGIYAYAIVEYGVGKPAVCLEIFRSQEIRSGFRRCFDTNDPQGWLMQGRTYVLQEGLEERVRSAGCEVQRELLEFADAFIRMARRSQTPKETIESQKLSRVDRNIKHITEKLEVIVNHPAFTGNGNAVITSGEPLTLASSLCRAAELGQQMREWFEVLGYRVEPSERWEPDFFEWVINIPVRRGRYDRVLVRGIAGEAGIRDVMALRESVGLQRTDEGWLVTARRISQAAKAEIEKSENEDLMVLTFDELLDQDADFGGYLDWLEREIVDRNLEQRYVPLACTKEEFDPVTHQRLGMSRYGEGDGWTEGYIDLWLDDPAKEHLSILGEFGTGKTWLTLHYALSAVRSYQDAKNKGVARPRLPIVIPLRDYAKAVSVESLFSEFFFRKHEIPIPGYSAFEQLNRMGKLLLIFDGFDEMAARVDKQQMINNFWELAKVVVPGSKVILTCRTEHFPDAKEGRSLLNAELQASTRGLSGETPQFEVLELEKFDDTQIREVLLLASSSETVEQVMGNPQLLDLARRPVMTELILEALPDIEAGKPVDMSRVYLYAVRRKMERDIRAERTFTSMADKLYFLCELSWEMLSNDRMSLNYREFPDRIRKLFGSVVQEEKDLDHWHYDMMGQTMLIRNSDGDYQPAHRSLLEFFVAFKFAAELGALAPDFLELAQMKSGIDRSLEPREYTWSEYFGGGAVAPLKGFVTESLEKLRSGFGKEVLSKAIVDLLPSILRLFNQWNDNPLVTAIELARNKREEEVRYVGGNIVTIAVKSSRGAFIGADLKRIVLLNADFTDAFLQGSNFSDTTIRNSYFTKTIGIISSCKFSLNGNTLFTSDTNRSIYSWDIETGQEKFKYEGHSDSVWSISLSDDENFMASCSADQTIRIWSMKNDECLFILNGHVGAVNSVIFIPGTSLIISGGNDKTIRIWNFLEGKCLSTFENEFSIRSMSASPVEKTFVLSGRSNTILLMDVESGKIIRKFYGHTNEVNSIEFLPDGKAMASISEDGTAKIWNIQNGECIQTFVFFKNMNQIRINAQICFSPDGLSLFTGGSDNTIKCWDIATGNLIDAFKSDSAIWSLAASLNKNMLVSSHSSQTFILRNLFSKEVSHTIQGYVDWINCISVDFEGILIASASNNQLIDIWSLEENTKIQTLYGHSDRVSSISFHPTKHIIISGSRDKTVKLWDLSTGKCSQTLKGHLSWVRTVAFTPDGEYVVSGGADKLIRIWDAETGLCIKEFKGHENWVESIAITPDGKLLISGSADKTIRVWDVSTGNCLRLLNGHTAHVRSVAISPCGTKIVSGSNDSEIRVWSIENEVCQAILKGHTQQVGAVSFGKFSNVIASGSSDKSIKLWNIEKKECMSSFSGHQNWILSLVFSQKFNNFISSSSDGTIKLWDSDTGVCLKTFTSEKPYEGMNITGVKGLTPATIATLKALGAIENEEGNEI